MIDLANLIGCSSHIYSTYAIKSIKVDNQFYRIRVVEEGSELSSFLEDDGGSGEEGEDSSSIPSEWTEEEDGDDDWYVEESWLEGKHGHQSRGEEEVKERGDETGVNGELKLQEATSAHNVIGNSSLSSEVREVGERSQNAPHELASRVEEIDGLPISGAEEGREISLDTDDDGGCE
ncbi:hypothetical protein L6452_14365 [Arctium lappa]|uniref:Uncharacterized protein n=1 Tax=Arctium lappa TaxID=4217 RepID=A0ACB9CL29_ARCLA|nr:hypothetical protein L6452_14365 [Arctium lappa]